MQNKQEYQDLSLLYESIYEEGILSRAGARVAGVKAATGQYFKNIGRSVVGKASPVGAGQAAAEAKTKYAFEAAAKNLLNDLQKLGLLPKGPVPQQSQRQVEAVLNDMIQRISPEPAQQARAEQPVEEPNQQAQQTVEPAATEPTPQQEPVAEPAPQQMPAKKAAKPRKRKAAPKKLEDGWQQVGGSKLRKVYSQSDEELAPMPSSFIYFGN